DGRSSAHPALPDRLDPPRTVPADRHQVDRPAGDPGRPAGLPDPGSARRPAAELPVPAPALEPELAPDRLQPLHDVQDVLVERHAELGCALLELVPGDLAREALVLHLLHDRADVDLV